ncbi:hypothetical protein POM88_045073 [Heracleum sosnowskyi]|uniref:Uncharacterized protein n=1 Tax=Heracleum sosnowskyi TaxID=360622 RepID=A0AAD8H6L0_9APIA|nr:hypothetical protein POM88_045073 [Heracleum sosnowskyi]
MYIVCIKNRSLRVVLYYDGAFVVSPHTGVRRYEAKKKMVKNNVEVKKLSVEEIKDMFSDVLGPLHWLYYFRNGITPTNGYKLLERYDQVLDWFIWQRDWVGVGVVRLHMYQEKLEDWGDPESEDEINA